MKVYIVFEDGIKNEWWYLGTFLTLKEANEYIIALSNDSISSHYQIIEYIPNKIIK
jgi:hypothetical protein